MELSLENLTAYANGLTEYNRLTTFLSEIKHEDAISKKLALIARFFFYSESSVREDQTGLRTG
jgi:hypothetical protein